MAKYEKKMMQIEAFQYDGDLIGSDGEYYVPDWAEDAYKKHILFYESSDGSEICIRKPNGEVVSVPVGYYIIRWSDTELYMCEPALFEASYKPVFCETRAKIYEIAREYGYEPQSRLIIEEMAELTKAINKHWRISRKFSNTQMAVDAAKNCIVEEIADVQIMLWQILHLLGVEDSEIESIIEYKISRQFERIEEQHIKSGGGAK